MRRDFLILRWRGTRPRRTRKDQIIKVGGGVFWRWALNGSLSRTRTCDKLINSQLLYQLSYQGIPLVKRRYSKGHEAKLAVFLSAGRFICRPYWGGVLSPGRSRRREPGPSL